MRPLLNNVRAILGWLSREWGQLTQGQRDSWDAWAIDHPGTDKFGDPFIMSGFNAFIMLNHTSVRMGGSAEMNVLPPEDPPEAAIDGLTVVTGATNPGEVDLTWTDLGTGNVLDYWEIQIAGPFQSAGRRAVDSRYFHKAWIAGNVMLATIAGLDEGMWYWFRVRYIAVDGQVTAWNSRQATPKLT